MLHTGTACFLVTFACMQMLPSVPINGKTHSRPRKPGRTSTTLLQRPSPRRGARSIEVDFSHAYCAIVESHSDLNHLPTSVNPLSSTPTTSMQYHNLFLATATLRDVSCAGAGGEREGTLVLKRGGVHPHSYTQPQSKGQIADLRILGHHDPTRMTPVTRRH
jgi:hypothetical protein